MKTYFKATRASLGGTWTVMVLVASASVACDSGSSSGPEPTERTLTVLYTNDEHGWLEEGSGTDGPAKLMGLWRNAEGYRESGDFLILSGGDNWTGPAISTWFQGESTVDVMNVMGYSATAIGNHEFDFTVDGLRARASQATFPFLAANIRLKGTNTSPDFATPYVIRNVNGIRVGLVGLASQSTPWTTFPTFVEDYDFISYQAALEEYVPQAWNAGADVMMVLGHICYDEMTALLPTVRNLDVSVLTGGHCNETVGTVQDGVALVVGGWQFAHYGKVTIGIEDETGEITRLQSSVRPNSGGSPDPGVQAVVATWQDAAAQELSEVVGYLENSVPNGSPALYNLITDSWLYADPTADIAMTNSGGIRQGLPEGDITKGTVVGVLPFLNTLVRLELTGSEVIDCLRSSIVVAGMSTVAGYLHSDGTPLKADSVYNVLTTDYLYSLGSYNFSLYDETAYNTGITYYQPTVTYLGALATSAADPLDRYLDHVPRR